MHFGQIAQRGKNTKMVVFLTNFSSTKDCDFLYCGKIREDLKDLRREMWLSLDLIFIFLCFLLLLISFLKYIYMLPFSTPLGCFFPFVFFTVYQIILRKAIYFLPFQTLVGWFFIYLFYSLVPRKAIFLVFFFFWAMEA